MHSDICVHFWLCLYNFKFCLDTSVSRYEISDTFLVTPLNVAFCLDTGNVDKYQFLCAFISDNTCVVSLFFYWCPTFTRLVISFRL